MQNNIHLTDDEIKLLRIGLRMELKRLQRSHDPDWPSLQIIEEVKNIHLLRRKLEEAERLNDMGEDEN